MQKFGENESKKGRIVVEKERTIIFSKKDSLAVKGIAIIMMMFHHCFIEIPVLDQYGVSFGSLSREKVVWVCLWLKICVSLFAFVSGYGLYTSYKKKNGSKVEWVIRRLIKTLSGFWIVFILAGIVCQLIDQRYTRVYFADGITQGIFSSFVSFMGLSNLFGMQQLISTWWYMSAAVIFIVMTPFFSGLLEKYGRILVPLFVVIIPRLLNLTYPTEDNAAFGFVFIFIIGMCAAQGDILNHYLEVCQEKITGGKKVLLFIAESVALIVICRWSSGLDVTRFWEICYGITPFLLIVYVQKYLFKIRPVHTVLEFLGKHSMNIYLVHTFIRNLYLKDVTYSFGYFLWTAVFCLMSALLISIILEGLKRLIRYNVWIEWLQEKVCMCLNRK